MLNSIIYKCTRALHSFLSYANCGIASTVSLLPPSCHASNLTLVYPHTCPPLTSTINTLLAIRYSSILSTCPNNLIYVLWCTQLTNSLSTPALLHTSSFITLSICDTPTKHLKHFVPKHSLSFSQHFSYSRPLLWTMHSVKLLIHIDSSLHLSPILCCSVHFLVHSIPHVHSVYHIPFTTYIHCYLRP